MMQNRTHTCGELRLSDAGKQVKISGWMENVRVVSANLAFVVVRDFYGTTQVVAETEDMVNTFKAITKESTISVEGVVRERDSKTGKMATGDIEIVPAKVEVLGRCQHSELPFQINRSREADEAQRLKYRYLDLRRPVQSEMLGLSVKQKNELGTLLTESAAPEKILSAAVTDPATGLHSLLSTKSYTDVIELLASDQLAKVVALARERYDYVIIDSPPLGFFSDSELLSDLSDASVLVVRQDTVPAPEINDAIDALRAGKAEFLGCILNDMAHLAAWSSGYGYGYGKKYDKYGYGQHSARKTQ